MMIILDKKPKKILSTFKQRGTTMVSLIVGMALSAFLLTVVLQVFTTTKNNYKLTQNIAEMNDAMRYVENRMFNILSYTGRLNPSAVDGKIPSINSSFTFCCCPGDTMGLCSTGIYIRPRVNGGLPDGQQQQIITLFQGDSSGNILTCTGNPIAANTTAQIKFSLVSGTGLSLRCDDLDNTGVSISHTDLVSDLVDGLWIKYGVDYTYSGSVEYYIENISGVVRSIKVAIILHSRDDVFTANRTPTFNLWGVTKTLPADKKLHRLQVFTIPLSQIPVPGTLY